VSAKPWGRRTGIALAIILAGLCLWHLAWLGFLTRGAFRAEYTKVTGGDGLAMAVNPFTDEIRVHAVVARTGHKLSDPDDLLRKVRDENLLKAHGTQSFRHGLNHQFDPYAMLLPYRVVVAPTALPYKLSSGAEVNVWTIDVGAINGNGASLCTLTYQTGLSRSDAFGLRDEAGQIWADFRVYADRTGCRETRIGVAEAGSQEERRASENFVTFSYSKGEDGAWREHSREAR
jgi:hypothetical protein